MRGTPEQWKELDPQSAAVLVEFRADEPDALDEPERAALELMRTREPLAPPSFSREREQVELLWRVREGLHGLLAAMRPPGASLIIEDVCVPPAQIASAALDLQQLLSDHGFLRGVAGHASAGNLHFMLTPDFGSDTDLDRYAGFMDALAELILDRYDGSLKAEHGTGLSMAPFVEREWGKTAVDLMWRVKRLADPDGIFAPGVVLNEDPRIHLKNLKSTPEIEEVATKCVECGFCEPGCPSRNVTTTPRQRIVLRREMARQPPGSPVAEALRAQYGYDAIETCAADSSCMTACPVGIDTGKLVKQLRSAEHSERSERIAEGLARRYATVEKAARAGLGAGRRAERVVGHRPLAAVANKLRRLAGDELVPTWPERMPPPAPPRLPATSPDGAAAVYLPACINRIFGNAAGGRPQRPTLPEALIAVSMRAGLPLWIPDDVAGICCGVPWSSKGYTRGHDYMLRRTAEALVRWSDGGRLPVVVDASSCTYGLRGDHAPDGVEILDSIEWVHDRLMPTLKPTRKLKNIAVHPTCASGHLEVSAKLAAVAAELADEVLIPAATTCCGMAGDRGWLHPELPASALRDVRAELDQYALDACVSSNRTCEIALHEHTGRPYESFVLLLEELTR
jgi:D-lactate dehydrogenase